jgi:predicted 3-demethylubiquinone-9 3-methyltransferase (glyoxalase superfamily)
LRIHPSEQSDAIARLYQDQLETDRYWNAITRNGGAESAA